MLIRHVGLFGCPSQIISDRGTLFTAEIIRELMILFGTDHVLTLAASKQENATVENANKRAQEFLWTMLFDHRIIPRWSDVLPLVQRIMMAEPNEVIGVSPAQCLAIRFNWIEESFYHNCPQEALSLRLPYRIGQIECCQRKKCCWTRHNVCSGSEIWCIWSSSMVFRHALTWAHMY